MRKAALGQSGTELVENGIEVGGGRIGGGAQQGADRPALDQIPQGAAPENEEQQVVGALPEDSHLETGRVEHLAAVLFPEAEHVAPAGLAAVGEIDQVARLDPIDDLGGFVSEERGEAVLFIGEARRDLLPQRRGLFAPGGSGLFDRHDFLRT